MPILLFYVDKNDKVDKYIINNYAYIDNFIFLV